jgi:hypothetical protein
MKGVTHAMDISDKKFFCFFLGSWASFIGFAILVYGFHLYIYAPFLGLVGYALMILLLLLALSESSKRRHYLLVSGSLMLFGALASFDLISSKEELTTIWTDWLGKEISDQTASGFVQSLSILIGIFTGSLASANLFYGLNKRNFPAN